MKDLISEEDKKWIKKTNRKLLAKMEQPTACIDLSYFSEGMMWYDAAYLKELGLRTQVVFNTEFHITPKNKHVYLYWGGVLYKKDTIS